MKVNPRKERGIELLLAGLSPKKIAEQLSVSPVTVYRWRKDMPEKPVGNDSGQHDLLVGFTHPRVLYRYDKGGERYYYTKGDEPRIYDSLTRFLKKALPGSPYLEDYKIKEACLNGAEAAKENLNRIADAGTVLHILISMFIRGLYSHDRYDKIIQVILHETGISEEVVKSREVKYKKSIESFARWVQDYEVEFYASEWRLASDELHIACTADVVCSANLKKYVDTPPEKRKRGNGIVDLKFREDKSGFFESHANQLRIQKKIFEENFPDVPIDFIANWSPKEGWKTEPKYEYKVHEPNSPKLDVYLEIQKMDPPRWPVVWEFTGDPGTPESYKKINLNDTL